VADILRPYQTCFSLWKRVASLKQINHDMVSHIGKARDVVAELKRFFVADSLEDIKQN